MYLPLANRRYAYYGFRYLPQVAPPAPKVNFNASAIWTQTEWYTGTGAAFDQLVRELDLDAASIVSGTSKIARLYVHAPDFVPAFGDNTPSVAMVLGRNVSRVWFVLDQEVIIENAGTIVVE